METETETNPNAGTVQMVRCGRCGASLSNDEELRVHLEGHAEKAAEGLPAAAPGPLHRCPFCPGAFDTPEALKAHLAADHAK